MGKNKFTSKMSLPESLIAHRNSKIGNIGFPELWLT